MSSVTVLVLHPPLPAGAGPLAGALDAARRTLAARHLAGFRAAGATSVTLVEEAWDEPFGARLRRLAAEAGTPGLVVLGSGALALARSPELSTDGYLPCPQAHASLKDVIRTDIDTSFVQVAGGRVVVRKSGTEALVRVMVEHEDVTLANTLRDRVVELLRKEA